TGNVARAGLSASIWPTIPPKEMMIGGEAAPNACAATNTFMLRVADLDCAAPVGAGIAEDMSRSRPYIVIGNYYIASVYKAVERVSSIARRSAGRRLRQICPLASMKKFLRRGGRCPPASDRDARDSKRIFDARWFRRRGRPLLHDGPRDFRCRIGLLRMCFCYGGCAGRQWLRAYLQVRKQTTGYRTRCPI